VPRRHYSAARYAAKFDDAILLAYMPTCMAKLLLRERRLIAEDRFVEIVIWRLSRPVPGSSHPFKYRMAFVVDEFCVLRFDNETGKGDHKHIGEVEVHYRFTTLDQLVADFWNEVDEWQR
jgi:hypothetical protein